MEVMKKINKSKQKIDERNSYTINVGPFMEMLFEYIRFIFSVYDLDHYYFSELYQDFNLLKTTLEKL